MVLIRNTLHPMLRSTHCADQSRYLKESIIGTATSVKCFIFIKVPLPWSYSAFETTPELVELSRSFQDYYNKGIIFKPLLFSEQGHTKHDKKVTILIYEARSDRSRYERYEYCVPRISQVHFVLSQHFSDPAPQPSPEINDLFVCVHGAHDLCCGKYGYAYYKQLQHASKNKDNVRVWIASHIGGHRFAPTLISMPRGDYYGHLSEEDIPQLLDAKRTHAAIAQKYRGCSLYTTVQQVAEGFGWEQHPDATHVTVEDIDSGNANIRVRVKFSARSTMVYTMQITQNNTPRMLLGSCGDEETTAWYGWDVRVVDNA